MSQNEPSPPTQAAVQPKPRGPGARDVFRSLRNPRVLVMLLLGFSAGLPFLLTGNTLGFWLREGGLELAAIGFLSWVGLFYSFKFLWAPVVDRVDAPLLGRLFGRRRGWMVLAQLVIGASLVGMAAVGPTGNLTAFVGFALATAFASATQDIVIDAWRIEAAETNEELAILSSAYSLGYQAAILATSALILFLAAQIGWANSYVAAGLLMVVGLAATLMAKEPERTDPSIALAHQGPPLWTPRGLFDAIAGPFIAFFKAHGNVALLMLAAISLYRLGDFVMGPMANPFYVDLGLDLAEVGAVRASVGLWASIAGVTLAGLCAVRFGFGKTLILGAIISPCSNLAFSAMAMVGPDLAMFSTAMAIDNFSTGFAGVALVAYMSSITSLGYTATQYALLSSFYALLGKFLKGFSGVVVERLQAATDTFTGYAVFFAGTAALVLPALVLTIVLAHRIKVRAREAELPPATA